jgi:hypothetical protein
LRERVNAARRLFDRIESVEKVGAFVLLRGFDRLRV